MSLLEEASESNVFARVGMSHLTRNIGDPYRIRMDGLRGIEVNTSSQPNSDPHFGTLTTLMCTAAVAAELREYFGKPVELTFDQLENAPDRALNAICKRLVDGAEVEYYIGLGDSIGPSGESVCESNMKSFYQIFDFIERVSGVRFKVRTYHSCQAQESFRRALLKILGDQAGFESMVGSGEGARIRFPCPVCKWTEKTTKFLRVIHRSNDEMLFESRCPDHGLHTARLSATSSDYFDTNTVLRDIAKAASLIEAGRVGRTMPLMVDGRDWTGRWDRCVHIPGLAYLGFHAKDLPARIYAPTVTDSLGAKLSKSLYVGPLSGNLPDGFASFKSFMAKFGEGGLSTLWSHIREWASDSAYMDRESYSVRYFELLLSGRLARATIRG